MRTDVQRLRLILPPVLLALLSGCKMVLLQPAGDVALQQRDVLVASTVLMLLIIVPVMAMIVLFAWRYRQSNKDAVYRPDWHHSTGLEVAIWAAPLTIIVALGAVTWVGTHILDPYRPLSRLALGRPIPQGVKPLKVEVVALDWKWLFIYPDLGIATINEMAAPTNTPIEFHITASHVMNSFFIPALAGQIYAMPGMETPLHAVVNVAGVYDGFSANYAGAGFSDMKFKFHGLDAAAFQHWVQAIKAHGGSLDRAGYRQLEKPTEREPVRTWAVVDSGVYHAALMQCVDRDKSCDNSMSQSGVQPGQASPQTESQRQTPDTGGAKPAQDMAGMKMASPGAAPAAKEH
jgi:cytochrome o ubiquinol oxidase subunit 2